MPSKSKKERFEAVQMRLEEAIPGVSAEGLTLVKVKGGTRVLLNDRKKFRMLKEQSRRV